MRVLIVLTSAGIMPGGAAKTGFSLAAFAEVFYALADAGVEVALASPEGGMPPHDPAHADRSLAVARFKADRDARNALTDTLRLSQIVPDDFDAAIYPGGPGTVLDLSSDLHSHAILAALARAGKPVGVIGDGVAALFEGPLVTGPDAPSAVAVTRRIISLLQPKDAAP
jgi:putative intracellular protease/amidase